MSHNLNKSNKWTKWPIRVVAGCCFNALFSLSRSVFDSRLLPPSLLSPPPVYSPLPPLHHAEDALLFLPLLPSLGVPLPPDMCTSLLRSFNSFVFDIDAATLLSSRCLHYVVKRMTVKERDINVRCASARLIIGNGEHQAALNS